MLCFKGNEARQEITKETFNKNIECIQCDLASLSSIRQFVNTFNESKMLFFIDIFLFNLNFKLKKFFFTLINKIKKINFFIFW
jgi:hypothetical protein